MTSSIDQEENVMRDVMREEIHENRIITVNENIQTSLVTFDVPSPLSSKKPNLSNEERRAIIEYLLQQSHGGKLSKGSQISAAALHLISTRTVRRIWQQYKDSRGPTDTAQPSNVSSRKTGRVGRKKVELDADCVKQVPLRQRTNIRSLANSLKMAKTTLHRRIKEGVLRSHSSALRPTLTNENKVERLKFCLSMMEPSSLQGPPKFTSMSNVIHVDEKWFYMTKDTQRYYLLPEEEDPHRVCTSKRFITKVMFLAAVARPRFGAEGDLIFDGKIGIFPFVRKEPAKRSSKNRAAGTLVTTAITSVTKEVYRSCLLDKVLVAVQSKWPRDDSESILIQQDNAKPHISPCDAEFTHAVSHCDFDIQLRFQPPNSPDMNVLDLGFFRSIQSLQHQHAPKTIDELIAAVEKAFSDLTPETLNKTFLSLQQCMLEKMKVDGNNNYKLPHMHKDRLTRENQLPTELSCDPLLLTQVMNSLL